MTTMTTPRPAGWKGGGEDFGFLRTFDGHIAPDRFAAGDEDESRYGYANVKWGFEEADLGEAYGADEDIHCDEGASHPRSL